MGARQDRGTSIYTYAQALDLVAGYSIGKYKVLYLMGIMVQQ